MYSLRPKSKHISKNLHIAMVGQTSSRILRGLCDALKRSDPHLHIAVYGSSDSGAPAAVGLAGANGTIDEARPGYEGRITKLARWLVNRRDTQGGIYQESSGLSATREPRWHAELRQVLGRCDALSAGRVAKSVWSRADLVHVQGMFWEPVHDLLAYRAPLKPMVVSLLGSDVLRDCQPGLVAGQQVLLDNADIITITGIELRETALAKYGRHLAAKFRQTYFPLDPAITTPILNGNRLEAQDRLRADLGIAADSILIAVGHNGSPDNQHAPLIRAMADLPWQARARIHLLLPMTYGKSEAYLRHIGELARRLELRFTIFDQFMADAETARLRLATDILVFAPVSDAFSASVSQSLMAGSVVICGAWLPYAPRRRAGFRYWEIDQPSDLPKTLQPLLARWPEPTRECAGNPPIAAEFFEESRLGQQWQTAYADAIFAHARRKST